ncbi:DUF2892 domain-containing protein [Halobacteriales archaeon QS_1_68_17]|nr:MAG: DUF2892 domain-containing protein [Halobacteriales archaeon QS_1_68_17]
MIEKNVGGLDRQFRFAAGCFLVAVGLAALSGAWAAGSTVAALSLAAGAGLLFNAATQRCLANWLLGVDTCDR